MAAAVTMVWVAVAKVVTTAAMAFWEAIDQGVEEYEREARVKREEEGRVVMGARKVCKLDPFEGYRRADEKPPAHTRISASGARYAELVEVLRNFIEAYREAYLAFAKAGDGEGPDSTVVFPRGTYRYRVQLNVRCVAAPPD